MNPLNGCCQYFGIASAHSPLNSEYFHRWSSGYKVLGCERGVERNDVDAAKQLALTSVHAVGWHVAKDLPGVVQFGYLCIKVLLDSRIGLGRNARQVSHHLFEVVGNALFVRFRKFFRGYRHFLLLSVLMKHGGLLPSYAKDRVRLLLEESTIQLW